MLASLEVFFVSGNNEVLIFIVSGFLFGVGRACHLKRVCLCEYSLFSFPIRLDLF